MDMINYLTDLVVNTTVKYAERNQIQFDKSLASDYLVSNKKRFIEMIENSKKDAHNADIFKQIDSGKITPLVQSAFMVSMKYEALLFAKDIVDYSKV
jgi:hypothetical protein